MDYIENNKRAREIFKNLVETYLATGEPVGSKHLAQSFGLNLSSASIRAIMQDLEESGLLFSPHISAGRLPTHKGLRFFVNALMEFGALSASERLDIEGVAAAKNKPAETLLNEASTLLSGLTKGAGVVLVSKTGVRLKHLEFMRLDDSRALVVMVNEENGIENRIINLPKGLPTSSLTEASNFMNAHIQGRSLREAKNEIERHILSQNAALTQATTLLIQAGLASWSGDKEARQLIVTGQSNLLNDLKVLEELEKTRLLLADIEAKRDLIELLSKAEQAEGVRIYIGSENQLFSLSGSSLIVAPYKDASHNVIGVLGVIGPTRLNYAKIVPVVDYTAKIISQIYA
jgi:heat-inducible transcriptional repressor